MLTDYFKPGRADHSGSFINSDMTRITSCVAQFHWLDLKNTRLSFMNKCPFVLNRVSIVKPFNFHVG